MKEKRYWEMSPTELARATRQFDESEVADRSRPLTSAERQQWQRLRKRGRPRVGQGAKRVSISMEQGLLKRATALAKKRHISRSRLLAEVLEAALAHER